MERRLLESAAGQHARDLRGPACSRFAREPEAGAGRKGRGGKYFDVFMVKGLAMGLLIGKG
eukprot:766848-Hanusia_phi.AAC.1